MRFFSPRAPSDVELAKLLDVDYRDRFTLGVEMADELIGMGSYHYDSEQASAEVAFTVADAHHAQGIGTLLLEHLVAAALSNGIQRFDAHTLGDNRQMLDVFRHAGFAVSRSLEGGVFDLAFDLSIPADGAVAERERIAETRSVARLLAPNVVAVIGASRTPGTVGNAVLVNICENGFAGTVHPVNPSATSIRGLKCYPSIADVPDHVDLAIIAVPAGAVAGVLAECGEAGVHGAVILSAGFAEIGAEGHGSEAALVRLARRYGMRLIGPNCVGIINTAPDVSLDATFAPTKPVRGSVGFVSQSGALGIAVLEAAESLGRRHLVVRLAREQGRHLRQRPAAVLGGRSRRPRSRCCTWSRSGTRPSSTVSPAGSRSTSRSSPSRAADPRRVSGRPRRTPPRSPPTTSSPTRCSVRPGSSVSTRWRRCSTSRVCSSTSRCRPAAGSGSSATAVDRGSSRPTPVPAPASSCPSCRTATRTALADLLGPHAGVRNPVDLLAECRRRRLRAGPAPRAGRRRGRRGHRDLHRSDDQRTGRDRRSGASRRVGNATQDDAGVLPRPRPPTRDRARRRRGRGARRAVPVFSFPGVAGRRARAHRRAGDVAATPRRDDRRPRRLRRRRGPRGGPCGTRRTTRVADPASTPLSRACRHG